MRQAEVCLPMLCTLTQADRALRFPRESPQILESDVVSVISDLLQNLHFLQITQVPPVYIFRDPPEEKHRNTPAPWGCNLTTKCTACMSYE